MSDIAAAVVPGSTGIFHIYGLLWIHEPADLTDYIAVNWSQSPQAYRAPADIRVYGDDETAVVRTFGATKTYSYTIPAVTLPIVAEFERRAGRVQLFRDARGRAYHGVYVEPAVTLQAPASIDLTIAVTEVTADHATGSDVG